MITKTEQSILSMLQGTGEFGSLDITLRLILVARLPDWVTEDRRKAFVALAAPRLRELVHEEAFAAIADNMLTRIAAKETPDVHSFGVLADSVYAIRGRINPKTAREHAQVSKDIQVTELLIAAFYSPEICDVFSDIILRLPYSYLATVHSIGGDECCKTSADYAKDLEATRAQLVSILAAE